MQIIAIAGGSGSGKTLAARRLVRLLPGSQVLGTDSYYKDLSDLPVADRALVNFDSPHALEWELLALQLRILRGRRQVEVPRYDYAIHARLQEGRRLDPCNVLVLEGLFALWDPSVRSMVDLGVFLDVPQDVCLARRIARDTERRGRTESSVRQQWKRDVAPMYREHVLPTREFADLVLDGTRRVSEIAGALVAALGRRRAGGSGVSLDSD